jgi:ketosteroid isomerase-like protein
MDWRMRMFLAGLVLACAAAIARSVHATTRVSDIAVIHGLGVARARAIAHGALEAAASYYIDDNAVLVFAAATATRRRSVRQVWTELMARPGYSMRCESTRIDLADARDMACDIGTFTLTMADLEGTLVTLSGKYVAVWKKQKSGAWRVLADSFNADH